MDKNIESGPGPEIKTVSSQSSESRTAPSSKASGPFSRRGFALTFVLTFCFWVLFSGQMDAFHLGLGALSCFLVSLWGSTLIFVRRPKPAMFKIWARFAAYLPWLFYQILLANLHLLYLTFHPGMRKLINPRIIRFDTCLKGDLARTVFANSITLTPGTITVYAGVLGGFAVHCIDDKSGGALPGRMEEKIAEVFDE